MTSARTSCPKCRGQQVVDLDDILYAGSVDFFRCTACGHLWHVEKGENGPPSYTQLGIDNVDLSPPTRTRRARA
jgi:predicted Zn finger-like uncharacterized protein